ncbi:hypothetical protein H0W91_04270 [Patescibacteria group bacterium]|nr:hypothetical protein [Patescibacteria group bacterium]
MEKIPTSTDNTVDKSKPTIAKKPMYENGKLLGHEQGELYQEFSLKKFSNNPALQCEFETESGNKYIIKAIRPEDTDENQNLHNTETGFMIVNTKTGRTSSMTKQDLENGMIIVGQPFEYGSGNTTSVRNIVFYEKGRIHLDQSVEKPNQQQENLPISQTEINDKEKERLDEIGKLKQELGMLGGSEKPKPTEFVTDKGSIYKYLPDGRTQRFKKATNEKLDIQDICVFIPPWDEISIEAKKRFPKILGGVEDYNDIMFQQILLDYQNLDGFTIRVMDSKTNEITTSSQLAEAGEVYMYLIDKNNPDRTFYLPVSKEPKVGYNTFDTRKYIDDKGITTRERHIGNKVVNIKY